MGCESVVGVRAEEFDAAVVVIKDAAKRSVGGGEGEKNPANSCR